MTQTAIGWVNLGKLAGISATSYDTLYPPENTIDDQGAPSLGWQTVAGVVNATITYTVAVPGSLVRLIGLFRTNLMPDATVTATVTYNSVDVWTETLAGPAAGYGQVVFVLPDAEYADTVTIEIDDLDNTDGRLNVPLVFIGNAWLPTYSVAPSKTDGWAPIVNVQRSRGGSLFQTSLSNPRTKSFEFSAIPEDEGYTAAMELARYQSLGVNVLFVEDIEGDNVKYDAIFGPLTARPLGVLAGASRMRTWGATIEERW